MRRAETFAEALQIAADTMPPRRDIPSMVEPLESRELRALKARAQLLKPTVRLGKEGISPAFLKSLDDALTRHELVKVKFEEFKEQKKELMPKVAESVSAHIILRVGNVLVLFRRKPVEKAS